MTGDAKWAWLLLVCGCVGLVACTGGIASRSIGPATVFSELAADEQTIELPTPATKGVLDLEQALARRRSVRSYSDEPLTLEEIGQLLWAAQGITSEDGHRTAPSAGALYPLEVTVATDQGLYHYEPHGHRVTRRPAREGWRPALCQAALEQEPVCHAPAIFVISAVVERTAAKYGDRAERYVQLEAGHAAQNLLLQATALGLGAVPVGAFQDNEVKAALDLPVDHALLYLIPVGH